MGSEMIAIEIKNSNFDKNRYEQMIKDFMTDVVSNIEIKHDQPLLDRCNKGYEIDFNYDHLVKGLMEE